MHTNEVLCILNKGLTNDTGNNKTTEPWLEHERRSEYSMIEGEGNGDGDGM